MSDRHQQTPYSLRIPDDLRARLEAAAKKNGRSLNFEIADRLKKSFAMPDFSGVIIGADQDGDPLPQDAASVIYELQKMLTKASFVANSLALFDAVGKVVQEKESQEYGETQEILGEIDAYEASKKGIKR
jgi:hypothetical protein